MSLLLSQVGAPPAPPAATPAVLVRPADVDSGQIELRGVVRLGFVVVAVVAAAVPALRVVPASLDDPAIPQGRVSTGFVVTTTTPVAPALRITSTLPDAPTITPRVSTGYQVAAVAPPAVVALRLSATLPATDALTPRTTTALAPVVVLGARITSTTVDDQPITGRVSTGYSVTVATTPAVFAVRTFPASLAEDYTFAGRVSLGFVIVVVPPSNAAPVIIRTHGQPVPTSPRAAVLRDRSTHTAATSHGDPIYAKPAQTPTATDDNTPRSRPSNTPTSPRPPVIGG